MTYRFEIMTQQQAEEIAYNWHYDGEYSFYDMEADEEDLAEFLDTESRRDKMFTVYNGEEVIGFFSVYKTDHATYDIGLGMRPDFTGRSMGLEFLKAGLNFVISRFSPVKITLSVATFNLRAIKVYRKIGFEEKETFMQETNGGTYEFLRMEYANFP
ncbi:GNAT family N-acetyltransferase [Rossellomorea sp. NS-SX7]|uniref:GNAT family N-acetyltransferase n=1 Tax=Rossellomorea sp. NS-SX7 TaxID=3463856 RepID=UPI004059CAB1